MVGKSSLGKGNLVDALDKHWHVLVYVLGLVFIGGMTYADNQAQNDKIDENTQTIESEKQDIQEVKEKLAAAEVERDNIKDDVEEIKGDVKEILRELRDRQ